MIKNLFPSKIFLGIQGIALFCFFFEKELAAIFAGDLDDFSAHISSGNRGIVVATIFILITYIILRQVKTLNPQKYKIILPKKVLVLSLGVETISIFKMLLFGEYGEGAREALYSGQLSLGVLKLNTPILYMLVMLFFGKQGQKNEKTNLEDALICGYIFLLFFLKDFVFGSRGSFLNVLTFSMAGLTFFQKFKIFTLKNIVRFGFVIFLGFFYLTSIRSSKICSMSDIYSSIMIKFSANLAVATNFINKDLYVTNKFDAQKGTTWYLVKPLYETPAFEIDEIQYFSTINIIRGLRRIIIDQSNQGINKATTYFFNIYGEYPFNSASYLFKVLLFGKYSAIVLGTTLVGLILYGRSSPHACFFAYTTITYFAMLSFTANALLEVPFCIMPFFSFIFKRNVIVAN